MPEMTAVRRFLAWQRALLKRQAARSQERALAHGLEEGCLFCGSGPWAWAYPMQRAADAPDGGEFLLPPWLPVCSECHGDVENGRTDVLVRKLHTANAGRRNRRMRDILPVFLDARAGAPVARAEAAHLVAEGRTKRR